jgi:hypothetical protein
LMTEILYQYRRRLCCWRLSPWSIADRLGNQVWNFFRSVSYLADFLHHSEGRGAAAEVDAWLSAGNTRLPSAGGIKTRV